MSELISMDDISYKLPITNAIFVLVILSYFVPFLLTNNQIETYLICKSDLSILMPSLDWINFLLSRFIFLDFKNYFFVLVLLTIFRFERIYGSKKFANYMFANFVVSSILELTILNLFNYFGILNLNHLANGCYSYIFALFINYCKDVPKEKFDFLGISFSEKLLVYFFGIQMMFTSYNVLIASLSGLLSGLICRSNAFNVCDIFHLPNRFLDELIKILNFILLSNKAPKEPSLLNGATQSDRRQQYIELYEENLLNDQFNFLNQSAPSSSSSSNVSSQSGFNEQEFEQNINQLKDMGFEIEKAKKTLKDTNNDLSRATHLLLEDS